MCGGGREGYIGVAVSVGPCVWVLHCSAFCNETRWVLFVFEVVLFFKISYFFLFFLNKKIIKNNDNNKIIIKNCQI